MMRRKSDLPSKPCHHCGRPMIWRKAWAKTWESVRHCSNRCRGNAKLGRCVRVSHPGGSDLS
ncbi:MAG: DUF2256 domain-containing protein [Neoaquamicrobium sediminum]|uniref:DUF2256 domain-containing protein n=1 Tax=Neoaquamicrobium sediminum TaxID=1849104 RepID=UPI004037A766